jgi:hypothetical protein
MYANDSNNHDKHVVLTTPYHTTLCAHCIALTTLNNTNRLLKASMLEPVLVQGDRERLAPTAQDFYCVHRTALNMLPPAETFPLLRRLCMALLRAGVAAASTRKASHMCC